MNKDKLKAILLEARKNKKMSHGQVAHLSGVNITRQYYGMIENGDRRPSVEVAQAIARVLDIEWTVFFEQESNFRLRNEDSA